MGMGYHCQFIPSKPGLSGYQQVLYKLSCISRLRMFSWVEMWPSACPLPWTEESRVHEAKLWGAACEEPLSSLEASRREPEKPLRLRAFLGVLKMQGQRDSAQIPFPWTTEGTKEEWAGRWSGETKRQQGLLNLITNSATLISVINFNSSDWKEKVERDLANSNWVALQKPKS